MEKFTIAIIGGGCIGTAIARDLALRGISDVVLLERYYLASGASGRNHGLLHSGARYVVRDPETARECAQENKILKRIAPHLVEETGGLFVALPNDPPDYADRFRDMCRSTGVEAEELTPSEALKLEPNLNRDVVRAFKVDDATIDSIRYTVLMAYDASRYGIEVRPYSEVLRIVTDKGDVLGVEVYDRLRNRKYRIDTEVVVIACGAWSSILTKSIGIELRVATDRGCHVVFSRRLTNMVVNRLRPPSDGDIILPHETTSIIGTTAVEISNPDDAIPTPEEVDLLIRSAIELIPYAKRCRAIRAYSGPRVLVLGAQSSSSSREMSRSYKIYDHEIEHGIRGLLTVVGGKLTTSRLIAERVCNVILKKLGMRAGCRTHKEPLPGADREISEDDLSKKLGIPRLISKKLLCRWGSLTEYITEHSSPDKELNTLHGLVCDCEYVMSSEVVFSIKRLWCRRLSDISKITRAGMGPCQGMNCAHRLASIAMDNLGKNVIRDFLEFLNSRWFGESFVPYLDQARQLLMKQSKFIMYGSLCEVRRHLEKSSRV